MIAKFHPKLFWRSPPNRYNLPSPFFQIAFPTFETDIPSIECSWRSGTPGCNSSLRTSRNNPRRCRPDILPGNLAHIVGTECNRYRNKQYSDWTLYQIFFLSLGFAILFQSKYYISLFMSFPDN
jgi:hypothetical protein